MLHHGTADNSRAPRAKTHFRAFAFASSILFAPFAACAVPITYTFTIPAGDGAVGSLSGVNFSGASVTYIGTADTSSLQEFFEVPFIGSHGRTFYGNFSTVQLTSLTVAVEGLPVASFLTPPTARYVYQDSVYFSDSSSQGYSGFDLPTLPTTPDILAAFTTQPITLGNAPFNSGSSSSNAAATTQGNFTVSYYTNLTTGFSATPGAAVPEPASLALLGIGLAGVLAARRRFPHS